MKPMKHKEPFVFSRILLSLEQKESNLWNLCSDEIKNRYIFHLKIFILIGRAMKESYQQY